MGYTNKELFLVHHKGIFPSLLYPLRTHHVALRCNFGSGFRDMPSALAKNKREKERKGKLGKQLFLSLFKNEKTIIRLALILSASLDESMAVFT